MQKFIASGNLCKDIELKTTSSGKTFVRNTIAIRMIIKMILVNMVVNL